MSREWRHRVTGSEAGNRLDRFVQESLPDLSRSQVKRLIDQGRVTVDGATVKAGHGLRAGESLHVRVPPPPAVIPAPQPSSITVVLCGSTMSAGPFTLWPGSSVARS